MHGGRKGGRIPDMGVPGIKAVAVCAALGCFLALGLRRHAGAQGRGGYRESLLRPEQEASQKIESEGARYAMAYGFRNFNGDKLRVQAELDEDVVADSVREFGFRKSDLDKLDRWYQQSQKEAIAAAQRDSFSGKVEAEDQQELDRKLRELKARNAQVQKRLEDTLAGLAAEYRKRRVALYTEAGFRFKGEKTVEADVPAMVRRNASRVAPVSTAFAGIAQERGYGAEELVGAVSAMVQTALRYEVPSDQSGTKITGGILPPPKTLVLGQGDCDTKTALLASVLKNWPNLKMVGLEIPGHYLMAVHRIPRKGEVFIEYEGLPFVMIESAGPAWLPPGTVGEATRAYLESGREFQIQPM